MSSDEYGVLRHVMAGAGAAWMTSLITCPLDVLKVRIQSQANWDNSHHLTRSRRLKSLTGTVPLTPSPAQSCSPPRLLVEIWTREGLRGLYRGLGITLWGYLPSFALYFPTYHGAKIWLARNWNHAQDRSPAIIHVLAASIAGALTNLVTNPLWVIRTRLMTQHALGEGEHTLYKGSLDALRTILAQEGVRGLYKAASMSIVGVAHVAIQFPCYEWLKERLQGRSHRCRGTSSEQGSSSSTRGAETFVPGNILMASTVSKVLASTATYPHEIIRTRLQIQRTGAPRYEGVLDACRKIWREEGLRGFYRGLRVNILRVIPASGVTFVTYEAILKYTA